MAGQLWVQFGQRGQSGLRSVGLADRHCAPWSGPPAAREAVPTAGTRRFQARLRADDQSETLVAVAPAFLHMQVERLHAPLDVDVAEHQLVAVDFNGGGAFALQFV